MPIIYADIVLGTIGIEYNAGIISKLFTAYTRNSKNQRFKN